MGIAEKDKEKTLPFKKGCLNLINVMYFGLCNPQATFQRLMDLTLAGKNSLCI